MQWKNKHTPIVMQRTNKKWKKTNLLKYNQKINQKGEEMEPMRRLKVT